MGLSIFKTEDEIDVGIIKEWFECFGNILSTGLMLTVDELYFPSWQGCSRIQNTLTIGGKCPGFLLSCRHTLHILTRG